MKKILLIEDEKNIVQIVCDVFEDNGFFVSVATHGQTGLDMALAEDFDLVILDIMLPGIDGFHICEKIKKKKNTLPVVMLTAKSLEKDKIKGLELGADDYITKPFSVKELVARINACLRTVEIHRKAKTEKPELVEFDDIKIDFSKMEVVKKGKVLKFTKKELDILRYLINRKGEIVSRHELLDIIWGYEQAPVTRTVDVFIARIRKKIEKRPTDPQYLRSIRSVGYLFDF
ncbi:MAG: response regulator transcription factor [Candidatus Omnitrophica bacterium]|nr:response regulator transcription factor [Candidatus Omnitrophota bacterium]